MRTEDKIRVKITEPDDQIMWFLITDIEGEDDDIQVERAYAHYADQRRKWKRPVCEMTDLAMEFGPRFPKDAS